MQYDHVIRVLVDFDGKTLISLFELLKPINDNNLEVVQVQIMRSHEPSVSELDSGQCHHLIEAENRPDITVRHVLRW